MSSVLGKVKNHVTTLCTISVLIAALFVAMPNAAHMQAEYDCGTYSSGAYNDNCSEDTTGGSTDGQSGGGDLSDTGQSSRLYAAIGVLCIAISIGLLVASRKKQKKPRE